MGWGHLTNGELLRVAEESGIDVFVTGDSTLVHEQNLDGRRLAIITLPSNNWPLIRNYVPRILEAAAHSAGRRSRIRDALPSEIPSAESQPMIIPVTLRKVEQMVQEVFMEALGVNHQLADRLERTCASDQVTMKMVSEVSGMTDDILKNFQAHFRIPGSEGEEHST